MDRSDQTRELDPRIAAGADYGNPDPTPAWMEVDWRARRRSVELPGARVDYVELGEGEPLLFLHGLSGGWQNWLENLPHFGSRYRAIALDFPGFGTSPMPEWEIGMPAYARLVRDFCEELGLEGTTLIGNSMGGFVAVEAATADPELYSRLVLVSAAGIINTWNPQARATVTAAAWSRFGGWVADSGRWIVAHPHSRQVALAPFLRYPGRLRPELLVEQMAGGRCPGFGEALHSLITRDIRERLATIEMPTLIVWGLSDRVIPVAAAISYHRRIPRSRLEIFERTGHVPQLERPVRFNALLDEFLG
jgi:pimeloyl-ACP methyl ester carboxylesterase